MKKIFAIAMTVAMLLALGTVVGHAATLPKNAPNLNWFAGGYSAGTADDFQPVGDVAITWDPQASERLDVTDGDMADWAAADYNMVVIDAYSMIWWADLKAVPEGWSITAFFVADADWLYVGLYVTDPAFAYGTPGGEYNGDAFQIGMNLNNWLGDILVNRPNAIKDAKNIFYSFSCTGDGAPIEILRRDFEAQDGILDHSKDGVKGSSRKTDTGWSAEFALSWEQIYGDFEAKTFESPIIYVGGEDRLPLQIGCSIYYLDRSQEAGNITWAAGTTNGITDNNGIPHVSWSAYEDGINLYLPYEEGMTINCYGIQVLAGEETEAPVTEAPETEAPETEAPETEAPETEAPATEAPETKAPVTEAPETTGAATEGGCASVVGFGAVVILSAAAAVVALKKKD